MIKGRNMVKKERVFAKKCVIGKEDVKGRDGGLEGEELVGGGGGGTKGMGEVSE